jgi:hypothetical protein
VHTVTRSLPAGDYGVVAEGRLVASVERKSLAENDNDEDVAGKLLPDGAQRRPNHRGFARFAGPGGSG